MKITIHKGRHRPLLPTLCLFRKNNCFERWVTFHRSCAYKLEGEDMQDINKLFGVGYFPHHHKDSARFGWNYNPLTDSIILYAYCYVKGERKTKYICSVPFERPVFLRLFISNECYFFDVIQSIFKDTEAITHGHNKRWKYWLGFYFGGNKPAPNTLSITMNKVLIRRLSGQQPTLCRKVLRSWKGADE